MFCLDTNIIIDFLRGNKNIIKKIKKYFDLNISFSITSLCICELYKGAYKSSKTKKNIQKIKSAVSNLEILDFNEIAYNIYGKSFVHLSKIGKRTNEIDLMIASICIANNKILVTRNKKHFENIPDLKLESW